MRRLVIIPLLAALAVAGCGHDLSKHADPSIEVSDGCKLHQGVTFNTDKSHNYYDLDVLQNGEDETIIVCKDGAIVRIK